MYERASYSERKELLAFIAKRFREEVVKYENFLRLPTPVTGTVEDRFSIQHSHSIEFSRTS